MPSWLEVGWLGAAAIALALAGTYAAPALTGFVGRTVLSRERATLAQADLSWIPAGAFVLVRALISLAAAILAWLYFGILLVALFAAFAAHHVVGLVLEERRRRVEAERQKALLAAISLGSAIVAKVGNAAQMVQALAERGPQRARGIMHELSTRAIYAHGAGEAGSLALAARTMREELSDPLFDDFALVLELHARHGGPLVPALDAVVSDWTETLRKRRQLKTRTAGARLTVAVLTAIPLLFAAFFRLTVPGFLDLFKTRPGLVLLAWMLASFAYGHRVMQRKLAPPSEERLQWR